jgi:cell volume regulation protein A
MTDTILIIAAVFLLLGVLASKVSDRLGVPVLLLFLVLGMLAGSEGVGGIYFDDPSIAQSIGIVALVLILFSGGLDTQWSSVRPIVREGILLSTLGVLLTSLIVGLFTHFVLGFSLLEGFLLGSIVSSTDAAAVFSVLRSKAIHLTGRLKPLLELESGSNDPMAIFLTIGAIGFLTTESVSVWGLIGQFVFQMAAGGLLGYLAGRVMVMIINRIKLGSEGLYPVLTLGMVLLVYGSADVLQANGFLAVYLAGLVLGRHDFIHKKSIARFHDGTAWLMQIAMFLTLGLFVFPSRLVPIMGTGLLVALCLMLVARPVGVFLSTLFSGFSLREKGFISWVGLRGAVPIILATYPMIAGLPQSELIFNIVFFVVLTSVLLQGTSIPLFARWLKVAAPARPTQVYPIEFSPMPGIQSDLKELLVATGSPADGRAVVNLSLPQNLLIILVARGDQYLISSGATVLQAGDRLLVLADQESLKAVACIFECPAEKD